MILKVHVGEEDIRSIETSGTIAVPSDHGAALFGDDLFADGDSVGPVIGDFGLASVELSAGEHDFKRLMRAGVRHGLCLIMGDVGPTESTDRDLTLLCAFPRLSFRPIFWNQHGWLEPNKTLVEPQAGRFLCHGPLVKPCSTSFAVSAMMASRSSVLAFGDS